MPDSSREILRLALGGQGLDFQLRRVRTYHDLLLCGEISIEKRVIEQIGNPTGKLWTLCSFLWEHHDGIDIRCRQCQFSRLDRGDRCLEHGQVIFPSVLGHFIDRGFGRFGDGESFSAERRHLMHVPADLRGNIKPQFHRDRFANVSGCLWQNPLRKGKLAVSFSCVRLAAARLAGDCELERLRGKFLAARVNGERGNQERSFLLRQNGVAIFDAAGHVEIVHLNLRGLAIVLDAEPVHAHLRRSRLVASLHGNFERHRLIQSGGVAGEGG